MTQISRKIWKREILKDKMQIEGKGFGCLCQNLPKKLLTIVFLLSLELKLSWSGFGCDKKHKMKESGGTVKGGF